MGFDGGDLEDALNAPGADRRDPAGEGEELGQKAGAPTGMARETMRLRIFAGRGDDQAALAGADDPGSSRPSTVVKTGNAIECESAAPLADGGSRRTHVPSDSTQGPAFGRREHDQGTLDCTLGRGWTVDHCFQVVPLLVSEHEGRRMHDGAPRDRR